jgi:hypothetical protein
MSDLLTIEIKRKSGSCFLVSYKNETFKVNPFENLKSFLLLRLLENTVKNKDKFNFSEIPEEYKIKEEKIVKNKDKFNLSEIPEEKIVETKKKNIRNFID